MHRVVISRASLTPPPFSLCPFVCLSQSVCLSVYLPDSLSPLTLLALILSLSSFTLRPSLLIVHFFFLSFFSFLRPLTISHSTSCIYSRSHRLPNSLHPHRRPSFPAFIPPLAVPFCSGGSAPDGKICK